MQQLKDQIYQVAANHKKMTEKIQILNERSEEANARGAGEVGKKGDEIYQLRR